MPIRAHPYPVLPINHQVKTEARSSVWRISVTEVALLISSLLAEDLGHFRIETFHLKLSTWNFSLETFHLKVSSKTFETSRGMTEAANISQWSFMVTNAIESGRNSSQKRKLKGLAGKERKQKESD